MKDVSPFAGTYSSQRAVTQTHKPSMMSQMTQLFRFFSNTKT